MTSNYLPGNVQHATAAPSELAATAAGTDFETCISRSKTSNPQDADEDTKALTETMSGWKVLLVVMGILMSMFLVALDRTIVSTAIPQITNEFHALNDYGWYGSAYMLSCCAVQMLFGKVFTFFSVKYTLFLSVLTFEVGSAICGSAPKSIAFIIGRAIAGIGAAGIFAGAMTSMIHVVPLHHKPKLFAAMGMMQVVAQIGGPLIGGAFTSRVTWRWCFYVNLPIGGAAMIVILLFLEIPQQRQLKNKPLKWKMRQLDFPGTILVASGAICILLALQWGGQTYAWNNGRVIALLIIGIFCLIGFGLIQVFCPDTATIPLYLFRNRSVVAAWFLFVFFSCSNFVFIYFIPNWFQAITHVSSVQSGIRTIPLMASSIVGLILGGILTSKIGYYVPFAILGAVLSSIGGGLISTWTVDTPMSKWIGYQIVNGIGVGFVYQIPNLAIQAVLPKKDAPTGFATALFGGLLMASVFVSVGENVLATQLVSRLSKLTGGPIDPSLIYESGATTLLNNLPANLQEAGLVAYNDSLRVVFQIGMALSCVCVPGACALEWKSVAAPWAKKTEEKDAKANEAAEESAEAGRYKEERKLTKTYHTSSYGRIANHHGFEDHGKTILITGGASGVGYSISKAFAGTGVARIAILSRSADAQAIAKRELDMAFPATQILIYAVSITDTACVVAILQELGTVDVLVLNAAVAHRRAAGTDITVDEVQEAFDTNIIGPFALTKAYLSQPTPIRKTVLHVSSVALQLSGYRIGYGPSKAAATQVMQHFAAERKDDGNTKIISFHPGTIWTPGTEKVLGGIFSKDAKHWEDIDLPAHFALWLAGSESGFLHGRFVWAQWDVDELLALQDQLTPESDVLKVGLILRETNETT
ncbi:major facilitator superfamily transporter aflatoxin efflux [Grosmannia clavigera kw1407]|uniref:Major facilitator superfamily transporter aflatoxin efflux n=1 Tax=Grosmannia clavigera (strain kw1407 / UAMH 11150) TaxID=655863 RepID=F0XGI5_GROCL|nr:major facilitator superfamily transporter aflatoxin efflux [Grosmannia clavigera kw1407]EFX03240.1 major facilitator superfamily transporter aflatoxin efflux [Grosmannia clavigera kw1407]